MIRSLCGTKCDVQASLLNYLTGFSQISEYSNFTLHNVKIPLQAALKPALAGGMGALNPPQMAGDLISPRGEKNYENSILAWRMKQIERYTHSHIRWVTSSAGSAGAVEEEEFVPEDSRGGHRAQVSDLLNLFVTSIVTSKDIISPAPLTTFSFLSFNLAAERTGEGHLAFVLVPLPLGGIQLSAWDMLTK